MSKVVSFCFISCSGWDDSPVRCQGAAVRRKSVVLGPDGELGSHRRT